MNEWLPFIVLAGILIGLFTWLRTDIRELGERLDKRIDDQDKRLVKLEESVSGLVTELAALKATVETYFRIRVDPPPPDPERHDQAA